MTMTAMVRPLTVVSQFDKDQPANRSAVSTHATSIIGCQEKIAIFFAQKFSLLCEKRTDRESWLANRETGAGQSGDSRPIQPAITYQIGTLHSLLFNPQGIAPQVGFVPNIEAVVGESWKGTCGSLTNR